MEEDYRYECATLDGFVQRVVVLSQAGYRFFVQGRVPERRFPEDVDAKMLGKYEVQKTRRQRSYRKGKGLSNGHYFRHGRDWVLMATGPEFLLEVDPKERVLDLREGPVRAGGYSISLRRDGSAKRKGEHRLRASVRLERETYLELRALLEELAVRRSVEKLRAEFWRLSNFYQSYQPVYRQWIAILGRVNERRKKAGFDQVERSCIRVYRRLPKHFDDVDGRTGVHNLLGDEEAA